MKNLKFSFALIVALVAVGITVATKAKTRLTPITGCFTVVELADLNLASFSPVNGSSTCSDVQTEVNVNGKEYIKSITVASTDPNCTTGSKFCCVELEELDPAGFPAELQIDPFARGTHVYQVRTIKCKP